MTHSVTLTGKVVRIRKKDKVAIVKDEHSYQIFVIPDRNYIIDQSITFTGQIMETERGSGYIRLIPIKAV